MKRILYSLSLLFVLLLFSVPCEGAVGTVMNGEMNQCDVNRDGNITATDVTALYNYLLGIEGASSAFNYDVNGDGNITSSDITGVYEVLLYHNPYNSIFDVFNLTIANNPSRTYFQFSWDDVTTLSYNVTNPDYMLVVGVDENFSKYNCWHFSDNSINIDKNAISEWLKSVYNWTSPSDVPSTITFYARVEVMLDNGHDVIISNMKSTVHIPELTFESSKPIHLWWLTGSFVATDYWTNTALYGNTGMVPMYPVQGATYNSNGEGPLEYYGYFPAGGQFKIIENPGSWECVIGGGNENGGQVYSGNTTVFPDNIVINQGGYYRIDLNTADKTMTMTRLSDSQASYICITIPGDYQDWAVDSHYITAIGQSNNHDWYTYLTLSNDSYLKFAPGSWDYDWGTGEFPYGKGYQGGDNIPAKAGNYHVYFNDLSGDYMFIDEENGLAGTNYVNITKNIYGDYINLTLSTHLGEKIKICDIDTDIEGDYKLCFNNTSVAIDQNGEVDLAMFKLAVFSTYDRPRIGGCVIYCHVEATSGGQTVKSNTIAIPAQVENYSIVIDGSSESIKMNYTGNISFNAKIPAGSSDIRFKIVPGSSSAESDIITPTTDYDSDATNGSFTYGNQSYFIIPYNSYYNEYEVEIDLGNKTYSIAGVEELSMIWQAGNTNNWGNPSDGLKLNYDGIYTGCMFLNGDYKFKENESDWDGENWGTSTYGNAMSGSLVPGGLNLTIPQGFYKVDVDLSQLTYNLTTISSLSVIGTAVPTGTQWQTDLDLTYNQTTKAWEGIYVLNTGEYKIRANHDWDLNWGGTADNLVFWGANLTISQPGPYKIQVFLTYDGDSHIMLTRQ